MGRMEKWIPPAMYKEAAPVVLVHGLWMPARAMHVLARRLEAQHFSPYFFSYKGRGPMRRSAQALVRMLSSFERPVHLVAHSLGGLVVLEALKAAPSLPISATVLLASPVRGCLCGRKLAAYPAGRWLLGDSEPLWREGLEASWTSAAPLGVIAGAAPWGLGRLFGPLPRPNDGVVCLEETTVSGMRDRVVVPISHSGMLFSGRVAAQAAAFLRWERFIQV